MRRALPIVAALTLVVAGPHRERFSQIHAPRTLLFVLLAALAAAAGRPALRRLSVADGLALASLGALVLSALFAHSVTQTFEPLALWAAAVALLVCAGPRSADRKAWLDAVSAAVIALAVLGALEAVGVLAPSLPGRAPSATLGQRNTLAHVLVLGSPLLWWQSRSAVSWRVRLVFAAGATLAAAVVVVTRCRAGYLMLPLAAVVFTALARRPEALATLGLGAVLGAVFPWRLKWAQPSPYLDTLGRALEVDQGSGAGRLDEARASLALLRESPLLGAGPGHWYVDFGVFRGDSHFAHSDWVGFAVERGAVGLLLLLGLGVALLWGWRSSVERPLVLATAVAVAGLMAADAVLQLPAALLLVTVVLGVGRRSDEPLQKSWAAAPLLVVALLMAARAASLWLSSSPDAGFEQAELAVRLYPFDPQTRVELIQGWQSAGDCERARLHARALGELVPRHPALAAAAQCGPP